MQTSGTKFKRKSMSRFIETIRCFNGRVERLPYHQQRVNATFEAMFPSKPAHQLEMIMQRVECPADGLFKIRVVYDQNESEVSIEPYQWRTLRAIKMIDDDQIRYPFKSADRSAIENGFSLRGVADDVLFVQNGFLTDTSYANIVFRSGTNWVTPAEPLLPGTMRKYLLDNRIIHEEEIRPQDLKRYQSFKLINAMVGWEFPEMDVRNIG